MKIKSKNKTSFSSSRSDFASGFQISCRIKKLRDLLKTKKIVRLLEAHSGLTGLIVEKTKIRKGNKEIEFDGIWESSLTDSISKGKPDISIVDVTSRVLTIHEILDVTTKPMVVDVDNGGIIEHFGFTVRTLDQTPYDKLKSLPNANIYLKEGISFFQLDKIAMRYTDNQMAEIIQKERAKIEEIVTKINEINFTKKRLQYLRHTWNSYKKTHQDWRKLVVQIGDFLSDKVETPTEIIEEFNDKKLKLICVDYIS